MNMWDIYHFFFFHEKLIGIFPESDKSAIM